MTGLLLRIFAFGAHHWSARQTGRSLRRMRRDGQLAAEPRLVGMPHLEIYGSVRIGRNVTIVSEPTTTHFVVNRGAHLEIGDDVTIGSGCGLACHSHISIGAGTVLADGVLILDSDYHVAGTVTEAATALPITIGGRVRIAENVVILRGSRIDDAAEVAADSVVSGFVAGGSTVSGVPAREIADHNNTEDVGDVGLVVRKVAQRVFRLIDLPGLADGPEQIERWDSLGLLSFLLALEDAFAVTLDVDRSANFASLADIAALIARTVKVR